MQEVKKGRYCALCGQLFKEDDVEGNYEMIETSGLCNECLEYHLEKIELEKMISEIKNSLDTL